MYRNLLLWLTLITAIPFLGPATAHAAPADDQYGAAAGHYAAGEWTQAADLFASFAAANPAHERAATAHLFAGESLVQLRKYDDARGEFQKLIEHAPQHDYARVARFRIGECLLFSGKMNEATEALIAFRAAHPVDEFNAFALPYLGDIALAGGQAEKARGFYEQALRDFPTGATVHDCRFGLARCRQSAGDLAKAIEQYEQVAAETDSRFADDARLAIGLILYQQKRYTEAEESLSAFRTTFEASPLAPEASYWFGMSQLSEQRVPAAIATFTAALEQFADSQQIPALCAACGDAYRQSGDRAQAELHYGQILTNWPDSEWADDALAGRVQLAIAAGDSAQAAAAADELLRRFPASSHTAQAQIARVQSLLASAQYTVAEDTLQKMIVQTATTQQEQLHYYLALAQIGQQKFVETLATLDQVDPAFNAEPLASALRETRLTALLSLKRHSEAIPLLREQLTALAADRERALSLRGQLVAALAATADLDSAADEIALLPPTALNTPATAAAVLQVAESAYRCENFKLAELLFAQLAAEGVPAEQRGQALSGLAWTQFRDGGKAASAATFERLLADYPDSPLASEAALVRARALEESREFSAALAGYRLLIEKYPQSSQLPQALLSAARMHDRVNQDREAAALLTKLIDEHPQFAERDVALYELAWAQTDLKQADESNKTLARLVAECPESRLRSDATFRLAQRAARQGTAEEAINLLDSMLATACEPSLREHGLYLRGQLAAAGGKWEDVARVMGQHVQDFPASPQNLTARYWQAEAAFRLGNYEDAQAQLAALESATFARTEPWLGVIPLRRAQCLAQENRWAEALQTASTIATRHPQFKQQYEAEYLIGRALGSQGRFDDARVAYLRVLDDPAAKATEIAAMAQWMIGESHFHQQHYAQAIAAYERCLDEHTVPRWQATSLLQAGKCRLLLGQTEEAHQDFSRVVTQYADQSVSAEARQRLASLAATATASRPSADKSR